MLVKLLIGAVLLNLGLVLAHPYGYGYGYNVCSTIPTKSCCLCPTTRLHCRTAR